MRNGGSVRLSEQAFLGTAAFRDELLAAVRDGARVAALFGLGDGSRVPAAAAPAPGGTAGMPAAALVAILAQQDTGKLAVLATEVRGSYPSLTPDCQQVHLF